MTSLVQCVFVHDGNSEDDVGNTGNDGLYPTLQTARKLAKHGILGMSINDVVTLGIIPMMVR